MKLIIVVFFILTVTVNARQGFGPGEQDWGYVQVRPGAHMFWWLYYTTADIPKFTDRPLVLWVQGGPGVSGTYYGNFVEFGALNTKLKPRNSTWIQNVNVLFIDNPVGTGFSYVENDMLLATNNKEIAHDMMNMINKFYELHPEFLSTPLYIMSESYGGKMALDFSLLLYQEIQKGNLKCNFKGLSLGDSWISPMDSILSWGPYLLNAGLIDNDGFKKITEIAQKTKDTYNQGELILATKYWNMTKTTISNITGGLDFYNIMSRISVNKTTVKQTSIDDDSGDYIMNELVRPKLGIPVNVHWILNNPNVFEALRKDFLKPVTNVVESLLNNTDIKIWVLTGQQDMTVDTPGTMAWIDRLNFNDVNHWRKAERKILVVNNIIEGYIKASDSFTMVWVDRSGHMIPMDNPMAMAEILRLFTNNFSSD